MKKMKKFEEKLTGKKINDNNKTNKQKQRQGIERESQKVTKIKPKRQYKNPVSCVDPPTPSGVLTGNQKLLICN